MEKLNCTKEMVEAIQKLAFEAGWDMKGERQWKSSGEAWKNYQAHLRLMEKSK